MEDQSVTHCCDWYVDRRTMERQLNEPIGIITMPVEWAKIFQHFGVIFVITCDPQNVSTPMQTTFSSSKPLFLLLEVNIIVELFQNYECIQTHKRYCVNSRFPNFLKRDPPTNERKFLRVAINGTNRRDSANRERWFSFPNFSKLKI